MAAICSSAMAGHPKPKPTDRNRETKGQWEVGMALMPPAFDTAWSAAEQPLLVLIADDTSQIRAYAVGWPDDPLSMLTETWRNAVEEPQEGCVPGPPERVSTPNPALLEPLQALAGPIQVEVRPTPGLEQALDALRPQLQAGNAPLNWSDADTLLAPERVEDNFGDDINADDLTAFFEAGAALHQQQPWSVIPSDEHLFQMSCSSLKMQNWIGCITGQTGFKQGLILFECLSDYQRYQIIAVSPAPTSIPTHCFISFEAWEDFSTDFQNDFQSHGWPLADRETCPIALQVTSEGDLIPVDQLNLQRLSTAAQAVAQLIHDEPDLALQWNSPRPQQKHCRVQVGNKDLDLSINLIQPRKQQQPRPAAAQRSNERIPAAMKEKVESLMAQIEPFCQLRLNEEYGQLIYSAVASLARKRPSPLLSGRESSWCAGIVHAVGMVNFLYDRSQNPHCKAPEIYEHFGVSAQTGQSHSKKVRDLLKMRPFEAKWTLPSKIDESPLCWMIHYNGLIVDARSMPLEIQIQACAKGLIPYVPAMRL
jgi:hypothetical protein